MNIYDYENKWDFLPSLPTKPKDEASFLQDLLENSYSEEKQKEIMVEAVNNLLRDYQYNIAKIIKDVFDDPTFICEALTCPISGTMHEDIEENVEDIMDSKFPDF